MDQSGDRTTGILAGGQIKEPTQAYYDAARQQVVSNRGGLCKRTNSFSCGRSHKAIKVELPKLIQGVTLEVDYAPSFMRDTSRPHGTYFWYSIPILPEPALP